MGADEYEVKNFVMCPINPDESFGEPVEWFCKAVKSFHGKKSYRSLYLYGQLASTPQALFNDLFDALFPI